MQWGNGALKGLWAAVQTFMIQTKGVEIISNVKI